MKQVRGCSYYSVTPFPWDLHMPTTTVTSQWSVTWVSAFHDCAGFCPEPQFDAVECIHVGKKKKRLLLWGMLETLVVR